MIDAGELRDIIKIIRTVSKIDENGFGCLDDIEVVHTLRAKKKTQGTKEYISANSDKTKTTYNFICRNRNIDSDMLLVYKEESYNIIHIHEFDNQFIQITCTKVD